MKRRTFFQMLLAFLGVPLLPKAVAKLDPIPVATALNSGYIPGPLIGCLQPFIGSTVPAGWLPCDGREISRSDYPELWEALGGTEATFHVPDMDARVLQGWCEQQAPLEPPPKMELMESSIAPVEPLPGFEPIRYIIKATDKICQQPQAAVGGPPT